MSFAFYELLLCYVLMHHYDFTPTPLPPRPLLLVVFLSYWRMKLVEDFLILGESLIVRLLCLAYNFYFAL